MREIKTAVVTGPTGAVGASLCHLLTEKGIAVYAVVRPGCERLCNLPESPLLTVIECDITELSALGGKIGSADAFFHLAWKNARYGRDDMKAQAENIGFAIDAADAASALGCKVFLGAGSQAEYGLHNTALTPETPCFPLTGYGSAKLCTGNMLRRKCELMGIDCIWLRILSVYGKYEENSGSMIPGLIDKLLAGERPSLTAGTQIWDYLYCEDAAAALLAAAQNGKGGAVYPLGSGRAMPLREYIEILRDAIDPSLPLGFGEVPYSAGQVMHLEADISSLSRDTGFKPAVSFEEGIRRTIDWQKERRTSRK